MEELKISCYKGTRILIGNGKRAFLDSLIRLLIESEFTEIQMPVIQFQDTFAGKVGEENNNLMFNFGDRHTPPRQLCLAPEYTSMIQRLAGERYKFEKNICLFYIAQCFRGERPQRGRWREFTQLGIEIINPIHPEVERNRLINMAAGMIAMALPIDRIGLHYDVTRGLDYYENGKGFEISDTPSGLQLCGGGIYDGGVGFAIGIDRLLMLKSEEENRPS